MRLPTSSEHACPTSGLLCGRLLVALVESVLRPGGWENMCRLMCHCVRHISLDYKHGRSVEALHSSRHVGRPARSSVPARGKSRAARRALWGARSVILRCNLKSIATRSIPPKGKRSLELVDILRIDCSSRIAACRVRGAERLRVLDESCELRGQTWGELTASRRTSETWVSTSGSSRSPSSSSCRTALPVCRHRAPCRPSNVT